MDRFLNIALALAGVIAAISGYWLALEMFVGLATAIFVYHLAAEVSLRRRDRRASSLGGDPVGRKLRDQYTRGERVLYGAWALLVLTVPPFALVLVPLGEGVLRSIGVALLVFSVVLLATPLTWILEARVRHRQSTAGDPGLAS